MKTIKSSAKARLEVAADGNPLSSGEVLKIVAAALRVKKWTKIPSSISMVVSEMMFVVNRVTADKLVGKLNEAFPTADFKLYAITRYKAINKVAADLDNEIDSFCIGDQEKGGSRIDIRISGNIVTVIWNESEMPKKGVEEKE